MVYFAVHAAFHGYVIEDDTSRERASFSSLINRSRIAFIKNPIENVLLNSWRVRYGSARNHCRSDPIPEQGPLLAALIYQV